MATVTPAGTDLYAALGVQEAASSDEIARAFRALAKELHPDTNGDAEAARRFAEVVAAYEVLSNHRTRRAYDARRRSASDARVDAPGAPRTTPAAGTPRWTRRRAWTAVVAGILVTLLGLGTALLTWQLHARDARRRAEFRAVTATRLGDGEITFTAAGGRVVRTREPVQHGEGTDPGPTVAVRYDPADPARVVVDASSTGRDLTLGIVALKLLIGGPVFVVIGARRLRGRAPARARGQARGRPRG